MSETVVNAEGEGRQVPDSRRNDSGALHRPIPEGPEATGQQTKAKTA